MLCISLSLTSAIVTSCLQIIAHSTGSAKAPKLIPWSNLNLFNQIKYVSSSLSRSPLSTWTRRIAIADSLLEGQVRKFRPEMTASSVELEMSGPDASDQQPCQGIDLDKERVVFISKERMSHQMACSLGS